MFPPPHTAESYGELKKAGFQSTADLATKTELRSTLALVAPDLFTAKNVPVKEAGRNPQEEHAKKVLSQFFPAANVTQESVLSYLNDMKIFKQELGRVIRPLLRAALFEEVIKMEGGKYQPIIRRYTDIKDRCAVDHIFYDSVKRLIDSGSVYGAKDNSYYLNKNEFEERIMKLVGIQYKRADSSRSHPNTSSSLSKFIGLCVETVRAPLRRVRKSTADEDQPVASTVSIAALHPTSAIFQKSNRSYYLTFRPRQKTGTKRRQPPKVSSTPP